MPVYWYSLRSKPRKEDIVCQQATSQGYEVYYPRLRVHPVNPRSRKFVPYFPGYLFIRADLEQVGVSIFQWMPHTLGLVAFGGEPAAVPENLIQAVRLRVEEINQAGGEILEGLKSGETIRIVEGPFRGYEAIFDTRLPGSERVRVLLEFLGNRRQVSLVVDVSQVERIKRKQAGK
jgi:transcription antitermination factor NusG